MRFGMKAAHSLRLIVWFPSTSISYIVMAYIVTACRLMANTVMVCIVVTYIAMARTVMACIAMALWDERCPLPSADRTVLVSIQLLWACV